MQDDHHLMVLVSAGEAVLLAVSCVQVAKGRGNVGVNTIDQPIASADWVSTTQHDGAGGTLKCLGELID